MEEFFTGYCRVLDGARTVLADSDDGTADCAWAVCSYAAECHVGTQISRFFSETKQDAEKI